MITKPKGTYDLYGKKGKETVELRNFIEELMDKFNYEYIKTPLLFIFLSNAFNKIVQLSRCQEDLKKFYLFFLLFSTNQNLNIFFLKNIFNNSGNLVPFQSVQSTPDCRHCDFMNIF